ncbi:Putative restriction endonuclease [Actinokineospora iranica]|uniref:Putative restriction endonuclease n=1 Tax=Actinokineospora iranica TaxID=1271860 RepID=A0A1G6KB96_9PSEU|nr:Putative restriction endonuclease [Actinokineospora iranica]
MVIPDLVVTTRAEKDWHHLDATDLLMVVEVVSRWSRTYDTTQKRMLYAEARVPYFLLVDSTVRPVAATQFRLSGEEYSPVGACAGGGLWLAEPFPVAVELG